MLLHIVKRMSSGPDLADGQLNIFSRLHVVLRVEPDAKKKTDASNVHRG